VSVVPLHIYQDLALFVQLRKMEYCTKQQHTANGKWTYHFHFTEW